MILNDVIKHLENMRDKHTGEMVVFVNGEHGENEPEMATVDHFSVGEAELTLGGDSGNRPHGIRVRDIIMQIGGY